MLQLLLDPGAVEFRRLPSRISMSRSRRLTSQAAAEFFPRAAAVACPVFRRNRCIAEFLEFISSLNIKHKKHVRPTCLSMLWRRSPDYTYLFYVPADTTQWCYRLKCSAGRY